MALDPIRTTAAITESHLRYLSTTFRLKDAELSQPQWKPDPFIYTKWLEMIDGSHGRELIASLVREARTAGVPKDILRTGETRASKDRYEQFLYEALHGDERCADAARSA